MVERGATGGGVPVIDEIDKVEEEEEEEETGKWWLKGLPKRYKLIGATSLAFVICNMDKVEKESERESIVGTWYQLVSGI